MTYIIFNTVHFNRKKHTQKGKGKDMIMLWFRQLVTGSQTSPCGIYHEKVEQPSKGASLRTSAFFLGNYFTIVLHIYLPPTDTILKKGNKFHGKNIKYSYEQ